MTMLWKQIKIIVIMFLFIQNSHTNAFVFDLKLHTKH
jgi:hypothetical protein